MLNYREWEKAKNTYIEQYKREIIGGKIYPFFSLFNVKTYRSSSNSPNIQNIPKKEKEIGKRIRDIIIPSRGNIILAYDYSGIEVAMAACYSKDERLIDYLFDDNKDMHRDQAEKIFLLPKEKITAEIRYMAKNQFVFPEFYGDYWKNISVNIWNGISKEIKEHLKSKEIINIYDFMIHIEKIEKEFWLEDFRGYYKYKREKIKEYERDGYIKSLTNFKYRFPLEKNEIFNYPFQGSAFHCLLKLLIDIQRVIEKRRMKSKIIGQIHDEIMFDASPEEENEIDELVHFYGTQKIKKDWPWIVVPLKMKKSKTKINGSLASIEEYGFIGEE